MVASAEKAVPRRGHRVAGGARAYKKVSVTLPADLLDEIRSEVGPGNLSRYLTEAVQETRRRQALREFLDAMEAEHGPPSEQDLEHVRQRWPAARKVL